MSTRDQILKEIQEFLFETGMSPSRFGEEAIGDRTLVGTLIKKKRDLKSVTIDKIRQHIAKERAQRGNSKSRSRHAAEASA